jgi:hypothetical protein
MDGIRARRLKCGSPCGRIIDEAGDTMIYSMFAVIMGYVVKVPPGWLTLGFALINIPQFAIEMNFIIDGNFKNCEEYFGPIETELLIAVVFWSAGFLGTDGINKPIGLSFVPDSILWVHVLLTLFIVLMSYFTLEAWVNCIKVDIAKTLRYGLIPFLTLGIAVFHASLSPESFNEQFVVFHILHSFSLNISSFKLMVANMTKQDLFPIGIEHFLQLCPAIIHMISKNKLERVSMEPLTCYICIGLMVVIFYGHMMLMIHQFLARNPDKGLIFILELND